MENKVQIYALLQPRKINKKKNTKKGSGCAFEIEFTLWPPVPNMFHTMMSSRAQIDQQI